MAIKNSFKDLPESILILYITSLISADTCIDAVTCKNSITKLEELKADLGADHKLIIEVDKGLDIVKKDLEYYNGLNTKKC